MLKSRTLVNIYTINKVQKNNF